MNEWFINQKSRCNVQRIVSSLIFYREETSKIAIGRRNPPKNVPNFYSSSPSIFMRHGGFSPSVYSSEILELEARQSGSLSSTVE